MTMLENGRRLVRTFRRRNTHPHPGGRSEIECIVLGVRDGISPSPKPPVQIFLGTEPAQYRAERVFLWSIEQTRDPSRMYKIYLMKELIGFDRSRWLTGFTNYRFAIPHFVCRQAEDQQIIARAIYNDVDQVYLTDPAQLFDRDLGEHGFVSISDTDTSVMLMDCARMAEVWSLEQAQQERRKTLEARARTLRGVLDPAWNARDKEYEPGHSKILHYTTIHTQPWQPFPQRYAYQKNPVAQVWLDLERAADAAGYQVFAATGSHVQEQAPLQKDTHTGGTRSGALPSIWVLADDRPGNTTQSVGLVQTLGWPYEIKTLHFTYWAHWLDNLFGARLATRFGLHASRSDVLSPPWPDLVIATGWRSAPVARWIAKQNRYQTRLVQLGRKGGAVPELFDLVVSCAYFRFPPHPQRIEVTAPLTQIAPERLAGAARQWQHIFDKAPHPWIAVLVGGSTQRHCLDAKTARDMGEKIHAFAHEGGGSLFITTSRRTGPQATKALQAALRHPSYIHQWQPGQQDNPYFAYLALADVLVVTGESESMLAEAAATGKPVYIYPLPERPLGVLAQLKEWLIRGAQSDSLNARGTPRPQQGWAFVCAWLIKYGFVRPRRDLNILHHALVQRGIAHFFEESSQELLRKPLPTSRHPLSQEIDDVACRVRILLGRTEDTSAAYTTRSETIDHKESLR